MLVSEGFGVEATAAVVERKEGGGEFLWGGGGGGIEISLRIFSRFSPLIKTSLYGVRRHKAACQ